MSNRLTFLTHWAVLLAASPILLSTFASAGELGFPGAAFGKSYNTEVSDGALAKSPAWRDADDNPPLSARKAIASAEAMVAKVVEPDKEWRRHLEGITLTQRGDRWFWRAQFIWLPKGGGIAGLPPYLDIIVLMDGTALKPAILTEQDHR